MTNDQYLVKHESISASRYAWVKVGDEATDLEFKAAAMQYINRLALAERSAVHDAFCRRTSQ